MIGDDDYWHWIERKQYLPETIDLVLYDYFVMHKTVKEIAENLELKKSNVYRWIRQAKKDGIV